MIYPCSTQVVSYIPPPNNALQFGKTCREFYAAAIPRYLSEVTIRDSTKLAGFCAFVIAEPSRHPSYMRAALVDTVEPEDRALLNQIFRSANSLKSHGLHA
ncbi:hypothetical protein BKA93DRAFT_805734 [Sparassis latifolia]